MKLSLVDVEQALSDALDLADAWASCGPETYTREERQRRNAAERVLTRLRKRIDRSTIKEV